jgi:arginase
MPPMAEPAQRRITLLDAPSNLGLRPPDVGAVPGVDKLAGALRDAGLLERLDARDAGVVVPPRYHPQVEPGSIRK